VSSPYNRIVSSETRVYEFPLLKVQTADTTLWRTSGTRAQGTSRCTAGNGGQLILDQEATSHVDEALIIATCLVMLKKEIDRRRGCSSGRHRWRSIVGVLQVLCEERV